MLLLPNCPTSFVSAESDPEDRSHKLGEVVRLRDVDFRDESEEVVR